MARPKWGGHFSPKGSGFGYLSFTLYRETGIDYPDIGYGMRVKVRKGLTLILFDGVITKISEKREQEQQIEVGCIGWKNVLGNDQLNRVYADTRTGDGAWSVDQAESGLYQPAKFDVRAGDELELRPRQRVDFLAGDYIEAIYTLPTGQSANWVSFEWESLFPSSYPFQFQIRDSSGNALLNIVAGGSQSGSGRTILATTSQTISVRLTLTAPGESTADDGQAYARLTSIVISSQEDYPVDMATVAADLADYMSDAGHGISSDVSSIEPTGRSLHPAVFIDDQTPEEILQWCADKGDGNGSPVCWGMELNDLRRLFVQAQDLTTVKYFLPPGESRTTVTGDAQNSRQKLYGVYTGPDDQQYRTADQEDTDVIEDLNGYFRREALALDGIFSSALAAYAVALSLSETKKPETSTSWEITGSILSVTGKRVPFDEILPGGMCVDRNFRAREATLTEGDFRDKVTSFYLIGVEVDYEAGTTRLIQDGDTKSFERYMQLIADLSR